MWTISSSALALSILLVWPAQAPASVFYNYTGNNYVEILDNEPPTGSYTTEMRLTISFELAAPLPANMSFTYISPSSVLSYSFDDGRNVLTKADSSGDFSVSTDGSGNILTWNIFASALEGSAVGDQWIPPSSRFLGAEDAEDLATICETISGSSCTSPFIGAGGSYDRARVVQNPGTWTFVPEPSTAALLGLGLVGLAVQRGRARPHS